MSSESCLKPDECHSHFGWLLIMPYWNIENDENGNKILNKKCDFGLLIVEDFFFIKMLTLNKRSSFKCIIEHMNVSLPGQDGGCGKSTGKIKQINVLVNVLAQYNFRAI